MKTLERAVAAPELLDEPHHELSELEQSLDHVAAVNRWLGGDRALLTHLIPLLHASPPTRILDIGTASADLPRRIVEFARKANRAVEIVATDVHPQMRDIAAERSRDFPEIRIENADARALPYADASFDVVLMSLTLHHFDEPEQLIIVRELARVARRAVIINELRRTRLNYIGARLLSWTLWRGNRLTRHDGPLSVLRAFTPGELSNLAQSGGLPAQIFTHYFQRVVLVIDPRQEQSA